MVLITYTINSRRRFKMMLHQPATFRPFMGIFAAFLAIAGWTGKNNVTDIITSTFSSNGKSMLNMVNILPLHFLKLGISTSCIVTAVSLTLQLLLNLLVCVCSWNSFFASTTILSIYPTLLSMSSPIPFAALSRIPSTYLFLMLLIILFPIFNTCVIICFPIFSSTISTMHAQSTWISRRRFKVFCGCRVNICTTWTTFVSFRRGMFLRVFFSPICMLTFLTTSLPAIFYSVTLHEKNSSRRHTLHTLGASLRAFRQNLFLSRRLSVRGIHTFFTIRCQSTFSISISAKVFKSCSQDLLTFGAPFLSFWKFLSWGSRLKFALILEACFAKPRQTIFPLLIGLKKLLCGGEISIATWTLLALKREFGYDVLHARSLLLLTSRLECLRDRCYQHRYSIARQNHIQIYLFNYSIKQPPEQLEGGCL
jgi:hypothetical protein